MAKVEIYTTRYCPYCVAAKQLLGKKGVAYQEIDVENDPEKRRWLTQVSGQKTVPQVFIDGKSMGGFSDIAALDSRGELDPLLK
jgi:glutaredoxin 3